MSTEDTHILRTRLAAVEAERDEALRKRDEARVANVAIAQQLIRFKEYRDAALARAERAERIAGERKAILEAVEAKVALGERIKRDGPEHLVMLANIIEWDDGIALSPIAEEA